MEEVIMDSNDTITGFQLPINFQIVGEVAPDDVKVYIKQSVYKALEELSLSNTDKELGSILIGSYNDELSKCNVIISEYVEAKYTDASAATLTFTHETWDYVYREIDDKYSEHRIVGWQHTHPGYGIFLSNYDMFIQENYFNMDFQIAYVIDPVQNLRGFFQWKNGKVERLEGFYVYDEPGVKITIDDNKKSSQSSVKGSDTKPSSKLLKVATIVLCAVVLALAFSVYGLQSKINAQNNTIAELTASLNNQENNNKDDATDDANNANGGTDNADEEKGIKYMKFLEYEIAEGDTLYEICEAKGISYADEYNMIIGINGITNPDVINAGEKILLPIQ